MWFSKYVKKNYGRHPYNQVIFTFKIKSFGPYEAVSNNTSMLSYSHSLYTVINYFHSTIPFNRWNVIRLFHFPSAGLFMGFSVISLIEIIYFFSIRPICALKRVENEKIKLNYVSKIRRVKQSPMMVSHANIHDHYMYHGGTSQNACEELQSKLISATRYMKSKLLSVWNSIVELSEDQMDEGQTSRAQYPYLDWSALSFYQKSPLSVLKCYIKFALCIYPRQVIEILEKFKFFL